MFYIVEPTKRTFMIEREIQEPQVLRMERTEEEKQRRHNEGDKGAKFSAAKEMKPRRDGISNTLTNSQKDNLLCEPQRKALEQAQRLCEGRRGGRGHATLEADGTIRGSYLAGGNHDSSISEMVIQHEDNPALTVTMAHEPKCYGESTNWRIRKLTTRECGRLMGCDDETIDKMIEAGIPKTQLYKLYGNSIAIPCLEWIFYQLFIDQSNKSQQLELF